MKMWLSFIESKFDQKIMIVLMTVVFLASAIFLSWISDKKMDPANNKNWWSIEFADPKSDRLDFFIENYSEQESFSWEIKAGKENITGNRLDVKKGEKKMITVDSVEQTDKKILIVVSNGQEKKEIYKNF